MNIKGKCIIVTGGAGGIGVAIVKMLLKSGAIIGVVDKNKTKLNYMKKSIKNDQKDRAFFYEIDIGHFEQVEETVNDFFNKCQSIDGLINNAAILKDAPLISAYQGQLKKYSLDTWHETLSSNLSGYFYVSREVVEKMVQKRTKGIIVNISSISSAGNIGQTSYAASKAAVNALTVTWAQELSMFGIRVAGLAPGMTDTSMPKNAMTDQQLKTWVGMTPLKRMATPEEIAEGILFIIRNRYFCGRILELDGGLRM